MLNRAVKNLLLFFFSLVVAASPVWADVTVFGPQVFVRDKGNPTTVTATFSVPNPDVEFTLIIQNGDEDGGHRVSSAIVEVNGVRVVGPSDFNQQVDYIALPITLSSDNELAVEIRSKPGTFLTVSVLSPQSPPIADAGEDVNALVGLPVVLNGSGSYDPDGDLITFLWEVTEAPEGSQAAPNDATRPDPQFVPDLEGDYVLELLVNDGELDSQPDGVTIGAAAVASPPNALAGSDQSGLVGVPVNLDGSASDDPDGFPLDFSWAFLVLPPLSALTDADIFFSDTSIPEFTPDVTGVFELSLTVDNGFLTDSDAVQVLVGDIDANVGPNANAGLDQAVRTGEAALLDGTGSFDPDLGSDPLGFSWELVARPAGSAQTTADIVDSDTGTALLTPDAEGPYTVRLDVTDGAISDQDNALVVADDTPPQIAFIRPPDGSIVDTTTPTFEISFSDRGSGLDLGTYQTLVNGIDVTDSTFVGPTGATYTPGASLPPGDNEAIGIIRDRAGNEASASTRFTVSVFRAIADCSPRSGTAPLSVRFQTRAEFTGGSIVRYRWDFEGDGIFDTSDAVARDFTRTFSQSGTFDAVLEVTNNFGDKAIDICGIVISGNMPTATADVVPSNGPVPLDVNLNCVGNDPDGSIVLYEWDFEGDGVFDFSSPSSGNTTHTYTEEGTFTAVCRVTDNEGLTGEARTTTTIIRPAPPGSPSVAATASPATGNAPHTVSFGGSAVDDGTIVLWEWDFDGDGTFDFSSPTSPATSFQYTVGGIFAAALRATDDEGKTGTDTIEIVVNVNVSLSILDDTLDLSPNNPGATARVRTTLSAGLPVRLLMKTASGEVVRTLVDEIRAAGTYEDAWDGRDDGGHVLPQGTYFAVLEYRFGNETRMLDLTNTTGGSRSNPPRSGIPRTFSPFAGQPLVITYTLSSAREVTAFIGRFNVDTRLITFFERVPMGRGIHTLTWNGESADGQLIHPPPGDSFLFGIFQYTLPSNAIFLHSGSDVSDLTATPSIFDPTAVVDDQGTPARSMIRFTLSNAADVALTVDDAETGVRVARLSHPGLPAGENTIQWDGRDENGVLLAPGRYRLGVAATDSTGFQSVRVYILQRVFY